MQSTLCQVLGRFFLRSDLPHFLHVTYKLVAKHRPTFCYASFSYVFEKFNVFKKLSFHVGGALQMKPFVSTMKIMEAEKWPPFNDLLIRSRPLSQTIFCFP